MLHHLLIMKIRKSNIILLLLTLVTTNLFGQDTLKTAGVQAILYTGPEANQPLVVGLGGAEGGNAWASTHWEKIRNQFIDKGYAFLAVGYFNCVGTPKQLDQIEIENIYKAITLAKRNPKINAKKVAIVGGSRGADLALLLGSFYRDISCVIGLSASHVVFPGHTQAFTTSCWTYHGKALPFVPVSEAAVPFLMKGDLRRTFETMLLDTTAVRKAVINLENINGPILLLSGRFDEIIPATSMAEKMVERLKANHFKFAHQHIALDGAHAAPTQRFDLVFNFLAENFIVNK